MRNAAFLSGNAHKSLDMGVPRREIGVPNGPVHAVAVTRVGLEIEIAPPPAGASPNQAASAELIPANPAELLWRVADVRVLSIVDEEMLRGLAERVILALDGIVARIERAVAAAAVVEFPGLEPLGDVVLAVLDVSSALD